MKKNLLKFSKKLIKGRNRLLNKFKPPVVVLMYHRVLENNPNNSPLTVTQSNFQQQMTFLKNNFNILRFEDDWNTIDKPSIVITFDDGYYDNYLAAKNILEPENIPATFFISTANLTEKQDERGMFWWDEIALHKQAFVNHSDMGIEKIGKFLRKSTPENQKKFLSQFRDHYKKPDAIEQNKYRFLTPNELIRLSKCKGVTIGAHTVNHPRLSLLDKDKIRYELFESKETIERIIGKDVNVCSYPYGGYRDINSIAVNTSKELGFDKAATTFFGNCYSWTNLHKIPRIQIEDINIEQFANEIHALTR